MARLEVESSCRESRLHHTQGVSLSSCLPPPLPPRFTTPMLAAQLLHMHVQTGAKLQAADELTCCSVRAGL